jgi:chaperonin GroEL
MKAPKIIKLGGEARSGLMKGCEFLYKAVSSTLGPHGQNFFLQKGDKITNDGVSIAREIESKDEVENRGITALRNAASKTNDEAGDGTTTAIILAFNILKEASRYLGDDTKGLTAKKTPVEIVKQLEDERKTVVDKLTAMATKVETEEQLIQSAIVSVEDDELGNIIGKAQWELGPDGFLIVEQSAEKTSSVQKINGIRIDNGLGTSLIINNQEKQSLEIENVNVIMCDSVLHNLKSLKKVIDDLVKLGVRNLAVVARGFSSECIQLCLQNINQGALKIYPINAPYTDQAEIMKDMAAVLGGTFYHQEERSLEDMMTSDVGFATKIVARRYDAIFTGKADDKPVTRIEARVKELQDKLAGEVSLFEQRNLKSRIAQMTNGFGIVKIGATSDTERNYKFDKAEDAVNAVRAALQEGVVPGAGLAFKQIADEMSDTCLLKRPLQSPYQQIISSSPKDFVISDTIKDPVKVLRVALTNACSIAGTLATAAGVTAERRPLEKLVSMKDEDTPEENQ